MRELAIHTPSGRSSVRGNTSRTGYHLCSDSENNSLLKTESSTATCLAESSCGMIIQFGGVRGSGDACGAHFKKYGSATTSVLIQDTEKKARIILDAGSGISNFPFVPNPQGLPCPTLLLLTHFHLDHIQGLPLFSPLYHADPNFSIAAAEYLNYGKAEDILRKMISPPFWPISPTKDVRYIKLNETTLQPLSIGPFQIRWTPISHPNGCTAFRIDHIPSESSVVFATDMEWRALNSVAQGLFCKKFCGRPNSTSCLIMDGQFDDSEYKKFQGWGHSTWQDSIRVAKRLKTQQLFITHHAPTSDDALLDKRQKKASALFPPAKFAQEGEIIFLGKRLSE